MYVCMCYYRRDKLNELPTEDEKNGAADASMAKQGLHSEAILHTTFGYGLLYVCMYVCYVLYVCTTVCLVCYVVYVLLSIYVLLYVCYVLYACTTVCMYVLLYVFYVLYTCVCMYV